MKKLFLIAVLFAFGCKKAEKQPVTTQQATQAACSLNTGPICNITWKHQTLATLTFSSSGIYLENGTNDGSWSANGCDSIFVTRPSNNFYYRIISVTADSLTLKNPVFGTLKYNK